MTLNFCTKVRRSLRKLGYARKAAARIARGCQFLMVFACGLLGMYSIASPELYGACAGAGQTRRTPGPGYFVR